MRKDEKREWTKREWNRDRAADQEKAETVRESDRKKFTLIILRTSYTFTVVHIHLLQLKTR